jgi:hypothetical protein
MGPGRKEEQRDESKDKDTTLHEPTPEVSSRRKDMPLSIKLGIRTPEPDRLVTPYPLVRGTISNPKTKI